LGWTPEGKKAIGTPRNILEKVSGGQEKGRIEKKNPHTHTQESRKIVII